MKAKALALMGAEHPIRVLLLLRRSGPLRFTEIRRATGLNPAQVDRALKRLRTGIWVVPETVPAIEGPVQVRYQIAKRGSALLKAVDSFKDSLIRQRATIGGDSVDEVVALYA